MQTENRLLDDLARMANGALNTLSGVREEIESRVRERVERMLADMDMVPREEFEAVRAMAQTARSEQEDLAARVAELERRLSGVSGTVQPATAKGYAPAARYTVADSPTWAHPLVVGDRLLVKDETSLRSLALK